MNRFGSIEQWPRSCVRISRSLTPYSGFARPGTSKIFFMTRGKMSLSLSLIPSLTRLTRTNRSTSCWIQILRGLCYSRQCPDVVAIYAANEDAATLPSHLGSYGLLDISGFTDPSGNGDGVDWKFSVVAARLSSRDEVLLRGLQYELSIWRLAPSS